MTTTSLNRWKSLPQVSIRGFYGMRFARIMPLLIGLLIVLSLLHLLGLPGYTINPEKTTLWQALLAALTFHLNWLEIKVGYLPGSWDVLWTLSIEEMFYLFFPLLCYICRKEWHFVAILSVFLIISPIARTVWFSEYELGDKNNFAYMDAIAIGCMAALVAKRFEIKNSVLNILSVSGWAFLILIFVFRHLVKLLNLYDTGLYITVLAIGTALLLIAMQKRFTQSKQVPSRFSAVFRYFGRNSYEIYLTHVFVVLLLISGFNLMNLSGNWIWALYISVIIISGLLGDLVARFFSNPLNNIIRLRLKQKLSAITPEPENRKKD
ncbi:MAG: acyltransferase [Bacteroidales bacterium]|nr:acyltransferase [Bacteroidales bacterium]